MGGEGEMRNWRINGRIERRGEKGLRGREGRVKEGEERVESRGREGRVEGNERVGSRGEERVGSRRGTSKHRPSHTTSKVEQHNDFRRTHYQISDLMELSAKGSIT